MALYYSKIRSSKYMNLVHTQFYYLGKTRSQQGLHDYPKVPNHGLQKVLWTKYATQKSHKQTSCCISYCHNRQQGTDHNVRN